MKSRYLWSMALVAALGGLLFGYDWVVIGGAKPFYEAYFDLTSPFQQAWAMSCALIGCLIGAVGSGFLSERIGRIYSLLISAVIFAVSALGTAKAMIFPEFVAWRTLGGVGIGMASALSPVYIAEIAPAESRGRLVCLNELTIVIGILLAQIVNWLIARPVAAGATLLQMHDSWNGQEGWRLMFAAAFVPATLFTIGALFLPERPRWLGRQKRWAHARSVLLRFGNEAHADDTLNEMRASFASAEVATPRAALHSPRMLRVLSIGVALAVLQQWCGINVIFNYAQEVFSAAGYGISGILFDIVITGVVMCLFTFIAIGTVEHLGRRRLMLIGCAGLAGLYVALGSLYYAHQRGILLLVLVVAAIACYAMTLAPITWVILSEIFPNEVRGTCMAICTTALWAACFVLTYTFPLLDAGVGTAATFWIYAVVCAAGFVLVYYHLPETKQKTLEEIQHFWGV